MRADRPPPEGEARLAPTAPPAGVGQGRGRPQAPEVATRRWADGAWNEVQDRLAAEEPLQVLLDSSPLSVLMRIGRASCRERVFITV